MSNILQQAGELRKIWWGFRQARVLLTANNYRVFDYLINPQTAGALAKQTGTHPRATEILLDALTGLGLLKKRNNEYQNTNLASNFLVTGSPHYQGHIIRHAETLWQNWSGLDEIMKTGKPFRKAQNHEAFILGMHDLASLRVERVLKAVGLKGIKTALDLGGGPGTYSIEMAKRGIAVTLFDRPETVEIARRVVEEKLSFCKISPDPSFSKRGTGNPPTLEKGGKGGFERCNINFLYGDFIHDDIGKGYDLILASQILHSMPERDNIRLLKKCKKALNPGGRIVIQEFLVSNDLTRPLQGALFSVNMLVNTEGGRSYAPDEMKGWLARLGMKEIKKKLLDDAVLISGRTA